MIESECRRCGKKLDNRSIQTLLDHLAAEHYDEYQRITRIIEDNFDFFDSDGTRI